MLSFFLLENQTQCKKACIIGLFSQKVLCKCGFMESWSLHTVPRFLLSAVGLRWFMSWMALQDGSSQLTTCEMWGAKAADWGPDSCSGVVLTCNLSLLLQLPLCTSSKCSYSLFTHKQPALTWRSEMKLRRMSKMRFVCWQLKGRRGSFGKKYQFQHGLVTQWSKGWTVKSFY